jgi:hypothetical protein
MLERSIDERSEPMASNEAAQVIQRPGPDPALKRLDRFVGTWDVRGRTLDSDEENVSGRLTFEWLPGGFFLQQGVELDFMGYEVKGLEARRGQGRARQRRL